MICDSYVRPCTLVRLCDECNYGSFQGECVALSLVLLLLLLLLLLCAWRMRWHCHAQTTRRARELALTRRCALRVALTCRVVVGAGRCVICGGHGISDAYYCKECTILEKDVSKCNEWVWCGGFFFGKLETPDTDDARTLAYSATAVQSASTGKSRAFRPCPRGSRPRHAATVHMGARNSDIASATARTTKLTILEVISLNSG